MGNIDGLDDFLDYLQRAANNIDNIMEEALEETATMVVADTKLNTPVKSGSLKRSWTHDEVKKQGNKYTVEVGSALEYAPHVEQGHRQGSSYIQGRFMLRDAIKRNENKLQQKINEKLESIR